MTPWNNRLACSASGTRPAIPLEHRTGLVRHALLRRARRTGGSPVPRPVHAWPSRSNTALVWYTKRCSGEPPELRAGLKNTPPLHCTLILSPAFDDFQNDFDGLHHFFQASPFQWRVRVVLSCREVGSRQAARG